MTWDDLNIVLAVYRSGNASAAANHLRVSHATVSRRIREIETTLGIVLVDRSGVRWRPTPICEVLAAQAEKMERNHEEALRVASAFSTELRGTVRISAPTGSVVSLLAEALSSLTISTPEISIIIQTEDDFSDISGRKADLAVRFTETPGGDLIGEHVGMNQFGYFANEGVRQIILQSILEGKLPNVPLLTNDEHGGFPNWAKGCFSPSSTRHYVYGFQEKAALASAGFGVALLPRIVGDRETDLSLIDSMSCSLKVPLWVFANSDTRSSHRISTVKRVLIHGLQMMSDRLNPL